MASKRGLTLTATVLQSRSLIFCGSSSSLCDPSEAPTSPLVQSIYRGYSEFASGKFFLKSEKSDEFKPVMI